MHIFWLQHISPIQHIPANENHIFNSKYIIREDDVYKKLICLKLRKSPGPEDVPNWMFKVYAPCLATQIASIFNESIQIANVPSKWKQGDIVPILKTPKLNDLKKDIRPFSLTPSLSKVCARFVIERVFESTWDVVDLKQFGSIPNFFTSHAHIIFVHHLLSETASTGTSVRVLLLDFFKLSILSTTTFNWTS